jgi:hypothetical protein
MMPFDQPNAARLLGYTPHLPTTNCILLDSYFLHKSMFVLGDVKLGLFK